MSNEYLDRFREIVGDDPWSVWAFSERHDMVLDYAWSVPDDRALDALVRLSPLVEVGAGGGYWTSLLQARGADVLAYDVNPPGNGRENIQVRRLWTEVGQAPAIISRCHPDRTLFLCWPPYDTSMAYVALEGYLRYGGQQLAFVGEDRWGCTGDDDFFDLIEEQMEEVEVLGLPQWPGIHDCLFVYRRKGGS